MKHIILTLFLLITFSVLPSSNIFATAAAPSTQNTSLTSSTISEQFEGKKGGFIQKMMAKRFAKKMAKAFEGAGSDDGKMVAILAYLTIIGFIIALVLHMGDKKSSLGGYHLAQVLGLICMGVIVVILSIIPILGWLIGIVVGILMLINWIVGLINAIGEQEKPMPIFGKLFDRTFRSLFE
ncbi:MAG: hypothetical protein RIR11_1014 [Bacteroidota bacterium]|jgi:uncharacterized membrane protein